MLTPPSSHGQLPSVHPMAGTTRRATHPVLTQHFVGGMTGQDDGSWQQM